MPFVLMVNTEVEKFWFLLKLETGWLCPWGGEKNKIFFSSYIMKLFFISLTLRSCSKSLVLYKNQSRTQLSNWIELKNQIAPCLFLKQRDKVWNYNSSDEVSQLFRNLLAAVFCKEQSQQYIWIFSLTILSPQSLMK